MTDYYNLYKTRSNDAINKIKQLEADATGLAKEILDLRNKLKSAKEALDLSGDIVAEVTGLRDRNSRIRGENSGLVAESRRLQIENGGLSEQMESTEKKLYEQQCENIRLSGAVGALERVVVTKLRGDK